MKTNELSYRSHLELSRVLTAAVVNEGFRQMLLDNPEKALTNGYKGEAFHLAKEEKTRLSAIRASSLAEFAAQACNC